MEDPSPSYDALLEQTRQQARQVEELRAEVEQLRRELAAARRSAERGSAPLRWVIVFAVLLIGLTAYAAGRLPMILMSALFLGAIWGTLMRPVAAVRGRLTLAAWRRPWERALRPVRWQAWNRVMFWAAAGLIVIWTLPVFLLDPDTSRELRLVVAVLTFLNVVLALLPTGRPVRVSWNALPLLGWLFLGVESLRILVGPLATPVELTAPFDGEWGVGQGGRSALVNHHYPIPAQSHALDLVKLEGDRACVGDSDRLESYPAFGATLRAPADGRVVRVVDGKPDMEIGKTDVVSLVGNQVVIEVGPSRYVLLAHMKRGSITVSEGQAVRAGDPIGQCGNSGNTSQPHLHLQVQNQPDFRSTTLRTYPMVFRDAGLSRSPRRNDRIRSGPKGALSHE